MLDSLLQSCCVAVARMGYAFSAEASDDLGSRSDAPPRGELAEVRWTAACAKLCTRSSATELKSLAWVWCKVLYVSKCHANTIQMHTGHYLLCLTCMLVWFTCPGREPSGGGM